MIGIPLNAAVHCTDGPVGRCTTIVIHLQSRRVTHLVVKVKGSLRPDLLVPFTLMAETSLDTIRLSCTRESLASLMPFESIEWRSEPTGCPVPLFDQFARHKPLVQPYSHPVKHRLVPPDHLMIDKNTPLATVRGLVGRVERLLVHPQDARVMRVVVRTGRLWNQKTMIIPFWRVARIGSETPLAETAVALPVRV